MRKLWLGKNYQQNLNLLDNKNAYNAMIKNHNPYGDGKAAQRIIKAIRKFKISF